MSANVKPEAVADAAARLHSERERYADGLIVEHVQGVTRPESFRLRQLLIEHGWRVVHESRLYPPPLPKPKPPKPPKLKSPTIRRYRKLAQTRVLLAAHERGASVRDISLALLMPERTVHERIRSGERFASAAEERTQRYARMCELARLGVKQATIARKFGCSPGLVSMVVNGRR